MYMKEKNNPRGIFSNLRANVTENLNLAAEVEKSIFLTEFSSTYRP